MASERRPGRKARRAATREHQKIARDLERLARLRPGGSPERPIAIDSPAVVDLRAVAKPCPLCDGPLRLDEHTAEEIDGVRLRVASVTCTLCGVRRSFYFRLDWPTVH